MARITAAIGETESRNRLSADFGVGKPEFSDPSVRSSYPWGTEPPLGLRYEMSPIVGRTYDRKAH